MLGSFRGGRLANPRTSLCVCKYVSVNVCVCAIAIQNEQSRWDTGTRSKAARHTIIHRNAVAL